MEIEFFNKESIDNFIKTGKTAKEAFEYFLKRDISELYGEEDVSDENILSFLYSVSEKIIMKQKIYMAKKPISDIKEIFNIINESNKIVVIIGAGASVGPDFRSPGGLYDIIAKSGYLSDPYKVFDLGEFVKDPSIFWRFAHTIFPSTEPDHSQTHLFLDELNKRGKLLRVYSQNVDTLEVGINDKLVCVHGSWRENSCLQCYEKVGMEYLRPYVEKKEVPECPKCGGNMIKPGIVFFGQKTNIEDADVNYDYKNGDLLIVIGTSLRVHPISMFPHLFSHMRSILINREPVTCRFSAELLGNCDDVIKLIWNELGWKQIDDAIRIDSVSFIEPNKFSFPDENGDVLSQEDTPRVSFLVSVAKARPDDLF